MATTVLPLANPHEGLASRGPRDAPRRAPVPRLKRSYSATSLRPRPDDLQRGAHSTGDRTQGNGAVEADETTALAVREPQRIHVSHLTMTTREGRPEGAVSVSDTSSVRTDGRSREISEAIDDGRHGVFGAAVLGLHSTRTRPFSVSGQVPIPRHDRQQTGHGPVRDAHRSASKSATSRLTSRSAGPLRLIRRALTSFIVGRTAPAGRRGRTGTPLRTPRRARGRQRLPRELRDHTSRSCALRSGQLPRRL